MLWDSVALADFAHEMLSRNVAGIGLEGYSPPALWQGTGLFKHGLPVAAGALPQEQEQQATSPGPAS